MQSALQNRAFEMIAGDAALDLVNTLDWRFRASGAEELLGSYRDLVCFCEQAAVLTAKQARGLQRVVGESVGEKALADARSLREASAEVLYSMIEERKPATAAIRTLENFFREAHARQELRTLDGHLGWDWTRSAPKLPLWTLALRAEELMTGERMEALRECGNLECRWLFLDTSKNHTRRWCDMKVCGNRIKARRFKAAHRG